MTTTTTIPDRLKKRFDAWDVDGDGRLERSDFATEAAQIAGAFGTDVTSPQGATLREALLGMFDFLAEEAGVGADGAITEDQFVSITQNLVYEQGEASFNRLLTPLVQAIVGLCDKNADGQINREEFAQWLNAVGMEQGQARDAFDKIDTNGNGELSLEELLAAVRDFHFGRSDVELLA